MTSSTTTTTTTSSTTTSSTVDVSSKSKSTDTDTESESESEETTYYYVSITGLKLKSIWYLMKFQSYSGPSMKQAMASEGNIITKGNYRDGTLHTLSVWKDRKSMVKFMASGGAHAQAMKITSQVSPTPGGTKVYGYETNQIPTWDEAIKIWHKYGRIHGIKTTSSTSGGGGGVSSSSTRSSSSSSSISFPSSSSSNDNNTPFFIMRHKALVVMTVLIFLLLYKIYF